MKLAANYYERGDYANAVRLFRKVAEQGYAGAQFNLGICYNEGHGVTKDYSQRCIGIARRRSRDT